MEEQDAAQPWVPTTRMTHPKAKPVPGDHLWYLAPSCTYHATPSRLKSTHFYLKNITIINVVSNKCFQLLQNPNSEVLQQCTMLTHWDTRMKSSYKRVRSKMICIKTSHFIWSFFLFIIFHDILCLFLFLIRKLFYHQWILWEKGFKRT